MKHYKIIRRDDGSRVRLIVSVDTGLGHRDVVWRVAVSTCEKRRRTWSLVVDSMRYDYRSMSLEDKDRFLLKRSLSVVSREEIESAMLELWESMRPKFELLRGAK